MQAMNLWLVTRPDSVCGYDEAAGFVVAAHNQNAARRLAAQQHGDEGEGPWLDDQRSTVEYIGLAAVNIRDERVLLREFNAG